jgi:galactose mutarotase-like enzyme
MLKIENEVARVEFKTLTSEWTSLYDKQRQIEYAWAGDPTWWAGRNPTLFPVVGKVWQEQYRLDGQTYHLGNHGFARASEFAVKGQSESELTLQLEDNEQTRAVYPRRFSLSNHYRLQGKKLTVTISVTNRDQRQLPFSVGAHPAFNCPLLSGEKFEDYRVIFEQEEKLTRLVMNADSSFQKQRQDVGQRKEMTLTRELFAQDALVFEHLRSEWVELQGPKAGVRVATGGAPWWGIWSKGEAPFVCLEPWWGHGDFSGYDGEFAAREGVMMLPAGETREFKYSIELI